MYLFVYIFLLMSIVSLYSQLILLQTAEEKRSQVAAAQVMYVWHTAAHDLALTTGDTPSSGTLCSLSPGGSPPCPHVLQNPSLSVPFGYPAYHFLPAGYNFTQKFSSFAYNIDGKGYVITYLQQDRTALGFSAGEIYTQMKRTSYAPSSYGQVRKTGGADESCDANIGRAVFTNEYAKAPNGTIYRVCYPVPASVPDLAIAYVSLL